MPLQQAEVPAERAKQARSSIILQPTSRSLDNPPPISRSLGNPPPTSGSFDNPPNTENLSRNNNSTRKNPPRSNNSPTLENPPRNNNSFANNENYERKPRYLKLISAWNFEHSKQPSSIEEIPKMMQEALHIVPPLHCCIAMTNGGRLARNILSSEERCVHKSAVT